MMLVPEAGGGLPALARHADWQVSYITLTPGHGFAWNFKDTMRKL